MLDRLSRPDLPNKLWCFVLQSPKKSYLFATINEYDRASWMEVMQSYIVIIKFHLNQKNQSI